MKKLLSIALFIGSGFLAACNSGGGGGGGSSTPAGSCPSGQVYTSQGCLNTCAYNANCGTTANGQCIPAITTATTAGTCTQAGYVPTAYGCLPQCASNYALYNGQCNMPISYNSTGIYSGTGYGYNQGGFNSNYCSSGSSYGYNQGGFYGNQVPSNYYSSPYFNNGFNGYGTPRPIYNTYPVVYTYPVYYFY